VVVGVKAPDDDGAGAVAEVVMVEEAGLDVIEVP
jgi:hypothetical protein